MVSEYDVVISEVHRSIEEQLTIIDRLHGLRLCILALIVGGFLIDHLLNHVIGEFTTSSVLQRDQVGRVFLVT